MGASIVCCVSREDVASGGLLKLSSALSNPTEPSSRRILAASLRDEGETETDAVGRLEERLDQLDQAMALKKSKTESRGDNIVPISQLAIGRTDMWIYLQVAHHLQRLRRSRGNGAIVAGLVAPAGGGKSTLVTVIRMLLTEVLFAGKAEEISIDDFLSSGPADSGTDRSRFGIRSRWDVHSTDEPLGVQCLRKLRTARRGDSVSLPRFQLATDTRLSEVRAVAGPVDFVLFEGWRVGVHHPNFFEMNREVDTLVYLESDFGTVLNSKREKIKRDIDASGYNLYKLIEQKYGFDVDTVFQRHYFAVATRYIVPVMQHADVVLKMGPKHNIQGVDWNPRRWPAEKGRQAVTIVDILILGPDVAAITATNGASTQSRVGRELHEVKDLTRAWGGEWVAELFVGGWIRAKVVACGPLEKPGHWAASIAASRGQGCPWDGLPTIVRPLGDRRPEGFPAGEGRSIDTLEPGSVIILGLGAQVPLLLQTTVAAYKDRGHQVFVAQDQMYAP